MKGIHAAIRLSREADALSAEGKHGEASQKYGESADAYMNVTMVCIAIIGVLHVLLIVLPVFIQ